MSIGKIALGIIGAVIVISAIGSLSKSKTDTVTNTVDKATSQPEEQKNQSTAAPVATAASEAKKPGVPTEYKSALAKANTYANTQHMSKIGLQKQLTSEYGEQFSKEAAQYAVDNVKTDWNANALAKAKTYQEAQSMSPTAIHDQLTSEYGEQFTKAEADFAIQHLND